jgi:hypothetical protein
MHTFEFIRPADAAAAIATSIDENPKGVSREWRQLRSI